MHQAKSLIPAPHCTNSSLQIHCDAARYPARRGRPAEPSPPALPRSCGVPGASPGPSPAPAPSAHLAPLARLLLGTQLRRARRWRPAASFSGRSSCGTPPALKQGQLGACCRSGSTVPSPALVTGCCSSSGTTQSTGSSSPRAPPQAQATQQSGYGGLAFSAANKPWLVGPQRCSACRCSRGQRCSLPTAGPQAAPAAVQPQLPQLSHIYPPLLPASARLPAAPTRLLAACWGSAGGQPAVLAWPGRRLDGYLGLAWPPRCREMAPAPGCSSTCAAAADWPARGPCLLQHGHGRQQGAQDAGAGRGLGDVGRGQRGARHQRPLLQGRAAAGLVAGMGLCQEWWLWWRQARCAHIRCSLAQLRCWMLKV